MTGPGKRKRGRGGSVPSPKERRILWEAIRTTSSYPSSVPPQVPLPNGNRMRIACQYHINSGGQKMGQICREREVLLLLKPLQKEDTAWSSIDAGVRLASVLHIPVSGSSETQHACRIPRVVKRGGERGGSPLLSHRKGDRRENPLQCCGYTHRADKGVRMPEKRSICQIG